MGLKDPPPSPGCSSANKSARRVPCQGGGVGSGARVPAHPTAMLSSSLLIDPQLCSGEGWRCLVGVLVQSHHGILCTYPLLGIGLKHRDSWERYFSQPLLV